MVVAAGVVMLVEAGRSSVWSRRFCCVNFVVTAPTGLAYFVLLLDFVPGFCRCSVGRLFWLVLLPFVVFSRARLAI